MRKIRRSKWALVAIPVAVLLIAVASVTASPVRQIFDSPNESVPQTITYQGVLTDANGSTVNDGPYTATFRIYTRTTGGSPLWEEQHNIQVENGLFSIILGRQSDLASAFDNGPDLFLGITVGSAGELQPRQPITSVPFAVRASDAETLNGLTAQDIADGAIGATDCALERRLATAVDRYAAPTDCLPNASTIEEGGIQAITPSIAVNSMGLPIIAYATRSDIWLALCETSDCESYSTVVIRKAAEVEGEISVAVDSQDRPSVSYMNGRTGNLKIATCNDATCSSVTINTVDDRPEQLPALWRAAGRFQDMVIVEGDLPRIAYARERNTENTPGGTSVIALCQDRLCDEVTLRDGVGLSGGAPPDDPDRYIGPGFASSVALLDGGGLLDVSIQPRRSNTGDDQLRVGRCANLECDPRFGSGILDGFNDASSSAISVAPDGNPVFALTISDTIVYVQCTGASCGSSQLWRPDHTGSNGIIQTQGASGHINGLPAIVEGVSMEVLSNGSVLLAYNDEGVGAMVARCVDVECNTPPIPIRIGKDVEGGTDMAIGPDGVPYITYLARDRDGSLFPNVLRCEDCINW